MNIINLGDASSAAAAIGDASKQNGNQAVIVQNYALTLQQQGLVNFQGLPNLASYETDINNGIKAAQGHAANFLDKILPNMIAQSTKLDAYFNLNNALATALDPSQPASAAIALMKSVQDQTQGYRDDAKSVIVDLQGLRDTLNQDSANFSAYVTSLNAAVNGDNGVLKSLQGDLDDIDKKINGAIAGATLSGLAIAGGVLLIVVGAVGEIFTGGAATAAIVAGGAVVAVGVGGAVASGVAIGTLVNQKNKLLTQQAQLRAEVRAAQGVSANFSNLAGGAGNAASAAQDMANAWTLLDGHLGNLIGDLERGRTDVQAIRNLYQAAAKGAVQNIQADNQLIQQQLTGVNKKYLPQGELLGDFLVKQAA